MRFLKGSPQAKAWGARMRALRKKRGPVKRIKRNAKGDYTGVLKLPFYIDRAVAAVLHDGPRVLDWEWDRRMSPENKQHFHDFLVSVHHPLAYEAGTPEQRFKRFINEDVMPRIEKNPGEAWHEREAGHAHTVVRRTPDNDEKIFYAGVESAHRISAAAAKKLKMNPKSTYGYRAAAIIDGKREESDLFRTHKEGTAWLKGLAREGFKLGIPGVYREHLPSRTTKERVIRPRRRSRRNPLAVFGLGNPPKRVSIAGVIYSRCLEIRAEKTKFKPGLYRHPFSRKAGVQILALDTGDLLVHSTRGVNLWEPV